MENRVVFDDAPEQIHKECFTSCVSLCLMQMLRKRQPNNEIIWRARWKWGE